VPGTRVTRALVRVVQDAIADDRLASDGDGGTIELSTPTRRSFDALRSEVDLDVTNDELVALLTAWTQMFGLLSFELFGQTRGLIDDHDAFFREAATVMGRRIGLT
jgi:hypothetical protein